MTSAPAATNGQEIRRTSPLYREAAAPDGTLYISYKTIAER